MPRLTHFPHQAHLALKDWKALTIAAENHVMTVGLMLGLLGVSCNRVDVVGLVTEDAGRTPRTSSNQTSIASCGDAAQLFTQALCSCGSVTITGELSTKASAGEPSAHVKLNGPLTASGMPRNIEGDLVLAAASANVLSGDNTKVGGDLWVADELGVDGALSVAGDAYVAMPLFGGGMVSINGDLLSPIADLTGASSAQVQIAGASKQESFTVVPPCACGTRAPDIAGWIAARRPDVDNAKAGFDAGSLAALTDNTEFALPTGTLWVSQIDASGDLTLMLSGKTTLLVQGDLHVGGVLRAKESPEADLAIFVAGKATLGAKPQLGDAPKPARSRLYVAGAMSVETIASDGKADKQWVGNLYAPQLSLRLSNDTDVAGALHVGELTVLGKLHSTYDSAVTDIVEDCDAH